MHSSPRKRVAHVRLLEADRRRVTVKGHKTTRLKKAESTFNDTHEKTGHAPPPRRPHRPRSAPGWVRPQPWPSRARGPGRPRGTRTAGIRPALAAASTAPPQTLPRTGREWGMEDRTTHITASCVDAESLTSQLSHASQAPAGHIIMMTHVGTTC
jgi:hypothetical protein